MNTALVLTLIAFIFVAFALLTGKVAPSVACGISIAFLWITGVVDETQVFENFISSNIIVMIGMMIVIAALLKTSILSHIASLVKGNSIRPILIVAMIVPFILCQFIGGVTSMITVLPLLIALASQIGIAPTRLVLPASVGAQAGLLALPIGGAAAMYLLKNQMAANVGCLEQLGFWDLFATRMPGTIVAMVFTVIWGYKLLPERKLGDSEALNKGPDVFKKSALPKWKEIATYIIFFGSLILMCFSRSIGISNTLIATVAAMLCGLLGILNEREMYQAVNWPLIFMMSFMLSIATAMANSGAGDFLAGGLSGIFGLDNMILIVAIVFIFCVILTQFMDNTALINIFTPIAIMACMQNNISALPIICAIDASCLASFSTPLASPSSLMAYKLGGYSMKEMLKFSIPIILLSAVVSIIWIPLYFTIFH